MPRRRLKVCSRPGCPNLCEGGRCTACTRDAEQARGSARERGYDSAWERTRQAFLDENPLCAEPGCPLLAVHVDHVEGRGPLAPDGHSWSALQGLCVSHHSRKTVRENGGFGWR